jgi:glycosyltransferase involved in cell wall biosynthesis
VRIAVYHELPSGGAKRALFETVRRLAEQHTVDVFSLSAADHEFCDLRPVVHGHRVASFEPLRPFRPPFGRLNRWRRWRDLHRLDRLAGEIAAEIDASGYDVVYVYPSRWTQAPSVLRHLATPTVYQVLEPLRSVHEPPISRPYQGWWSPWVDRVDPVRHVYVRSARAVDALNTARASKLLANSRYTASNVCRVYGRSADVCYPGVDTATFRPLPGGVTHNGVLSVGEVRPGKGFDFVIAALATLPLRARSRLRIVANAEHPPERAYLADVARRLDVELLFEVGLSDERLVARYNEAAMVVYAPVREPLGLAALEAMACGVPVVGVAEGGVRETVVDGVTGLLVERDERQFAEAVATLLADEALRGRLGEQGRRHAVQRWSWEAAVEKLEQQLAAVVGRRAS